MSFMLGRVGIMIAGLIVWREVTPGDLGDGVGIPDNFWLQLPLGFALLFVPQMPWIFAVLRNKLRPASQFAELVAQTDKQLAAGKLAADERVTAAEAERDEWKAAWLAERTRGDNATMALAQATAEMGQVTTHLARSVVPSLGGTVDHDPSHADAIEAGSGT